MSAQTYAVVTYEGADPVLIASCTELWRARAKILDEVIVRGCYGELVCSDADWPGELIEVRTQWLAYLTESPGALRPAFRWHASQSGWRRPRLPFAVELQHPHWAEYRLITYHLAMGRPDKLRQLITAQRRVGLAVRVLPLPLRRALRRAIG